MTKLCEVFDGLLKLLLGQNLQDLKKQELLQTQTGLKMWPLLQVLESIMPMTSNPDRRSIMSSSLVLLNSDDDTQQAGSRHLCLSPAAMRCNA